MSNSTPKRKRCSGCGKTRAISCFHKNRSRPDGLQSFCKDCGKAAGLRLQSEPRHFLVSALRNMRSRKECDLTIADLLALWQRQSGCCALSGEPMTMLQGQGGVATNCSVDCIDPNRGYVTGNVQLVQRRANMGKFTDSVDEYVCFCEKVVRYQKKCRSTKR